MNSFAQAIINLLFQQRPTLAELPKAEFMAYRAVSQRPVTCREWRT